MSYSTKVLDHKTYSVYEHERYDEDGYRDMLDEIYGEVEICGMSYLASRALEDVDPVAFRCGMADSQEYFYTAEAEDGIELPDEYESIEDCTEAIDELIASEEDEEE